MDKEMIHAICDFCGKDCELTATLVSLTAFQNFARYHRHSDPYGVKEPTKSFVMCSDCLKEHDLPNPYKDYSEITDQKLSYKEVLPHRDLSDIEESSNPLSSLNLPLDIGDTAYLLQVYADTERTKQDIQVLEVTISSITCHTKGHWKINMHTDKSSPYWKEFSLSPKAIGTSIFLTRESAMKRYNKMVGVNHEET